MFSGPAWLLAQFYSFTHSYGAAIALITLVVMAFITPLTLKSTKGMLEMQRLQPEMRKLQQQYKNDRQKLNEEMMRLYQEHKVNPLASCLPLAAQMPVFFIMYRLLHGLTQPASASVAAELTKLEGREIKIGSFAPKYVGKSTELYNSLVGKFEMKSIGLDLSKTPKEMMTESFGKGLIYALLVVALGVLYFVQQRQIASRTVNPSMSANQQKLMQYLPVVFAVFQLFFPTGLVVYYIMQTVLRIGQQSYITRRFYKGDESLGRQAQRAGHEARELAQQHKSDKGESSRGGAAKSSKQAPTKPAGRPGAKAAPVKPVKPSKPAPSASARPAPSAKPKPTGRATPPVAKPSPSGNRPTRPTGANPARHPKPKKP